jgi:hypothetical protein
LASAAAIPLLGFRQLGGVKAVTAAHGSARLQALAVIKPKL